MYRTVSTVLWEVGHSINGWPPTRFLTSDLVHDVKDTVSETREITHTERYSLKDFDFVVAAFGKTVSIRVIKSIQYVLTPIVDGRKGCLKFWKIIELRKKDPVTEPFRSCKAIFGCSANFV